MTMALAFWILMLLWLVLDLWSGWPNYPLVGRSLLLFLLFALLGWRVFGAPIHG